MFSSRDGLRSIFCCKVARALFEERLGLNKVHNSISLNEKMVESKPDMVFWMVSCLVAWVGFNKGSVEDCKDSLKSARVAMCLGAVLLFL